MNSHTHRDFWRSRFFALALAIAPLSWVILWFLAPESVGWPVGDRWVTIAFAGIFAPFIEEAAFRGILQPAIQDTRIGRRSWVGISVANAVTSALFVAYHFLTVSWPRAMMTFIPSLIFGVARERSGGISAPIALHVLYNVGILVLFHIDPWSVFLDR